MRLKQVDRTAVVSSGDSVQLEKATIIASRDRDCAKTPMTTRQNLAKQHQIVIAEAMNFIDNVNDRAKPSLEFDDAWNLASQMVEKRKLQELYDQES